MLSRRTFSVIHVGVGFLIVYSADTVLLNIQKLINYSIAEENPNYYVDGYVNLGIHFIVFGLSFILAPSIVSLVGCRFTMLIGACGMAVNYFIFSLELTWVAYLGSAMSGCSSSITWVAEGQYLIQNSHEYTLSRDVSLFWAIYAASDITGNALTTIQFAGLTKLNQNARHNICYTTAAMGVAGGIVLSLVQSPRGSLNKSIVNENPKEALKGIISTLKNKNVSVLFLMFCFVGFQQSLSWTVYAACIGFTKQFGDITVELVPITAAIYGIGGCSAALLLSTLPYFNVACKRRYIVSVGLAIHLLCQLGTVLNLPNNSIFAPTDDISVMKPNVVLALICAFGFGIGDTCFNTQIYTLLGFLCPKDSAQTVSLYELVKSMSVAAFFFISLVVGLDILVLIVALAGIIGVSAFHWVDLRVEAETEL